MDHYDFTSNDIHLHSNDPDLALLEGAKAQAYRKNDAPSLYAFSELIPFYSAGTLIFAMNQENQLQIAASHVEQNDTEEASQRAWSVMGPRYRIPYVLGLLTTPWGFSAMSTVKSLVLGFRTTVESRMLEYKLRGVEIDIEHKTMALRELYYFGENCSSVTDI